MELSRSEQKRRIKQLKELVVELTTLPPALLNKLPAEEEVRILLKEVVSLKGGAKQRQIKYITKMLRNEPAEDLYQFLAKRRGTKLEKNKQLHEIEYLRDILIEEAIAARRKAKEGHRDLTEDWSSTVVEDIAEELPSVDRKELNRLAFLFAMSRNRQHSRELFRMLRAAQEHELISRKMEQ